MIQPIPRPIPPPIPRWQRNCRIVSLVMLSVATLAVLAVWLPMVRELVQSLIWGDGCCRVQSHVQSQADYDRQIVELSDRSTRGLTIIWTLMMVGMAWVIRMGIQAMIELAKMLTGGKSK